MSLIAVSLVSCTCAVWEGKALTHECVDREEHNRQLMREFVWETIGIFETVIIIVVVSFVPCPMLGLNCT